jgi:hypothetical protein
MKKDKKPTIVAFIRYSFESVLFFILLLLCYRHVLVGLFYGSIYYQLPTGTGYYNVL